MDAEKLNISLPRDTAQMVRRHVENGAYASDSDVIRDALQLWEQPAREKAELLDAIRNSLDAAAADPNRTCDRDYASCRSGGGSSLPTKFPLIVWPCVASSQQTGTTRR